MSDDPRDRVVDATDDEQARADRLSMVMAQDKPIYSRYLGKHLTERVNELRRQQEQAMSLADEVAVMQALAGDSMELYEATIDATIEAAVAKGETPSRLALAMVRNKVGDVVMPRLERIAKLVLDIRRATQGGLDPQTVQAIIVQYNLSFDRFVATNGDKFRAGIEPEEVAREFAEWAHNDAQLDAALASSASSGGSRGPELIDAQLEADAMDMTVPLGPHSLNGHHQNGAA